MAQKQKKADIEQMLAELEAVVENLERGDMGLDESLKAFESGIRLTRQCQDALQLAEQRVQQLLEQNGVLQASAFSVDDEQDEVGRD